MPTRPHPLGLAAVRRLAVAIGVVVLAVGPVAGTSGAQEDDPPTDTTTSTSTTSSTSTTTSSTLVQAPEDELPIEDEPAAPTSVATAPARSSDPESDPAPRSGSSTGAPNPLLVDGPTNGSLTQSEVAPLVDVATTGSGGAGAAPAQVTAADDDVAADDDDDEAEAKVRRIMYALIAIAALLAVLTGFYWWYTRPSRRGRTTAGTVGTWQTDSTSTR